MITSANYLGPPPFLETKLLISVWLIHSEEETSQGLACCNSRISTPALAGLFQGPPFGFSSS